jgi:hypothetical protein
VPNLIQICQDERELGIQVLLLTRCKVGREGFDLPCKHQRLKDRDSNGDRG